MQRGVGGYLFIASVRSRILRGCRLIVLLRCIACSGLCIPRATIVCDCFDVEMYTTVEGMCDCGEYIEYQGKLKKVNELLFVKVSKKKYHSFKGCRFHKKKVLKNERISKKGQKLFYNYYLCKYNRPAKDLKAKYLPFLFFSNYYIINIDI